MKSAYYYQCFIKKLLVLDGVPAFLLRLYLAPVFIIAGFNKLELGNTDLSFFQRLLAREDIVAWFGNNEWGLGLPYADFLANLAAWTEFLGGWFLLFGLLTRLVSLPLMFTMIIAATSVHADNGWFAVTPTNPDTSPAKVFVWLGFEQAQMSLNNSASTSEKLTTVREILEEHGNTEWLYENGNVVVLNNGIEFASTYFLMLLALFFIGSGRFTSADYYLYTYWLKPKYIKQHNHL